MCLHNRAVFLIGSHICSKELYFSGKEPCIFSNELLSFQASPRSTMPINLSAYIFSTVSPRPLMCLPFHFFFPALLPPSLRSILSEDQIMSARLIWNFKLIDAHLPASTTLQDTTAHCNKLHYTATHCNTRPELGIFAG